MGGSPSHRGSTFTSDQFTFSERDAYAVIAEISNVSTLGVALKASQNIVNQNNEAKELISLLQMEGISGYTSQKIADPSEISNKVSTLEVLASNYIRAIAEINNCDAQSAVSILQQNFDPNIAWGPKDFLKLAVGITAVLSMAATPWPDEWLASSMIGYLGIGVGFTSLAATVFEYVGEDDASTIKFAFDVLLTGLPILPGIGKAGSMALTRIGTTGSVAQNELKLLMASRAAALENSAFITPLAVLDYPGAATDIAALLEISRHDAEELLRSTRGRILSQQALMESVEIKVDGAGQGIIDAPEGSAGGGLVENRLQQWLMHHGVSESGAQALVNRNAAPGQSQQAWGQSQHLLEIMPPDLREFVLTNYHLLNAPTN